MRNHKFLMCKIVALFVVGIVGKLSAQQYATPYEKSKAQIINAEIKLISNERRLNEGNEHGDTSIENGIPEYKISGNDWAERLSTVGFTCFPAAYEGCWWYVSHGTVVQYYDDLIKVYLNTNATDAVLRLYSPQDSLLAEWNFKLEGKQYPLSAGEIKSGNQSIKSGDVPETITAGNASGGICDSFQYQWQYSTQIKEEKNATYEDMPEETNGYSVPFDESQLVSIAVRRRVVCGEDTAYTSSVVIDVSGAVIEFDPGEITSGNQIIPQSSVPEQIVATSAASSCAVTYDWQYSTDGVQFDNMPGKNDVTLSFENPLEGTFFYRRKATSCDQTGYTNTIYITFSDDTVTITPPPPPHNELDSVLLSSGIDINGLFNLKNDTVVNIHLDATGYLDSLNRVQNLNKKLVEIDNYSSSKLTEAQIYGMEHAEKVDDIGKLLDRENNGGAESDSTPIFIPLVTDSMLQQFRDSAQYDVLDSLINSTPQISFDQAFSGVEQQLRDSFERDDTLFLEPRLMRQSAQLNGKVLVKHDEVQHYTASFLEPLGDKPDIRWVVKGGVITSSSTELVNGEVYANVRWTSNKDIPFIGVIDVQSKQYRPLGVYLRPRLNTAYPAMQYGYYNQTVTDISAVSCMFNIPSGYQSEYQWQELDFYGDNVWHDLPGETNETLQARIVHVPLAGYRRVTIVRSSEGAIVCQGTSTTAWVSLISVFAFNYGFPTTVEYNTSPFEFAYPAIGGMLTSGAEYHYSWEVSENGGPWTQIGEGVNFPTSYKIRYRDVAIRRVVTITGAAQSVYNYPERFWKYIGPVQHFNYYYKTVDYENRNYIRENVVLTRGVQNWEDADLLPVTKKIQTTTYLDGLSRPIQIVGKATSYTDKGWFDIVKHVTYDASGGAADKNYLSYPTSDNPGKYKTNAASAQAQYYLNEFGDHNPFAKVDFDNSPLNKVKKAYAPGDSWVGAGVNISGDIVPYSSTDNVKYFKIGYDFYDGTYYSLYNSDITKPVCMGSYGNLQLIKKVGIDEKGKKVITYTDKRGNTILKKVQLAEVGAGLTDQHAGWLCTYYVYDDFNQLRFTITPKVVAELDSHNWSLSSQEMDLVTENLCFWYRYDNLGRLVVKKSPGKAPEFIAYDNRNRPVATQDAGIALSEGLNAILVTLYDEINRPVMTGILYTRKFYQVAEEIANAPEVVSTLHAKDGGDIKVWAAYLTETVINNESKFKQLTFNYYDDYSYDGAKTFDASHVNNLGYQNASAGGDIDPNTKSLRNAGMVTGSKTRVLNPNSSDPLFLTSSIFYDEEGRSLQNQEDNIKGGVEITSTQYHFDGRVLSVSETHNMPGTDYVNFNSLTKYKFDVAGRIIGICKKINNTARSYTASPTVTNVQEDVDAGYKKIAIYEYNLLGRRIRKVLSPNYNNNQGLESIDYSYNIRGWLTGINKDYALNEYNSSQWQHFFGLYLGYANADGKFAAAQYNGNVTGVIWKSQGDNTPRKFDYEYDNANRLKAANFNQRGSNAESWNHQKVDFSTKNITYDENGNLLTLTNMGVLPGATAPVTVDNLSYTYSTLSNKLIRVDDAGTAGAANGKLGDFKDGDNTSGTDDYQYDEQGRLILDNNKRITGVKYNYLDKPEKITVAPPIGSAISGGFIEYTYDAVGTKVRKLVDIDKGGGKHELTTTTYIKNFIYSQMTLVDNSVTDAHPTELQMILHEEGRIRIITPYSNSNDPGNEIGGGIAMPGGKQGVFDYFIKDNLGNVRATITEEINKASNVCTMESADATIKVSEENIFGNPGNGNEVNNTRVDRPYEWTSCIPPGQTANDDQKVSVLKATASGVPQTGPNVLLKVMAGDEVSAKVDYYYQQPVSPGNNSSVTALVNSLLAVFANPASTPGVLHAAGSAVTGNLNADPGVAGFFTNAPGNGTPGSNVPRAYLNYIFFDEQFNFIGTTSGFLQVQNPGNGASPLVMNPTKAVKNGYVYVYISNEANQEVYFDNFQVTHNRGRLIAEEHYYAFGLKITGVSSKAVSNSLKPTLANYGYQGNNSEEVEDFDLNYNEFFLRTYDPQIGRWTTTDPYNEYANPYTGLGNDPINNIDPSGGFIIPPQILQIPAKIICTVIPGEIAEVAPSVVGATLASVSATASIMATISQVIFTSGLFFSAANLHTPDLASASVASMIETSSLDKGQKKRVAETAIKPRMNPEGTGIADDLKSCDGVKLVPRTGITKEDLSVDVSTQFDRMKELLTDYSTGSLEKVALQMLDKFRKNEGGQFKSEVLNKNVERTEQFQTMAQNVIKIFEADYKKTPDINKITTRSIDRIDFSNFSQKLTGLGILIHQVWSTQVDLQSLDINDDGSYSGVMRFTLSDNFGLDEPDIVLTKNWGWPTKRLHTGRNFKAWFLLQHYYCFKAFETVIEIDVPFKFKL